MIKGQKMLNVTYMAEAFDKEANEWIEGETCMNIQMAEDVADLLLLDKETVRGKVALDRSYALESVIIIIDHNERIKNRRFISGSIKGFELVENW